MEFWETLVDHLRNFRYARNCTRIPLRFLLCNTELTVYEPEEQFTQSL
jgi:hypothetical protein